MLKNLKYILDIGSSKISLLAVGKVADQVRIVSCEDILYDGYMDGKFLSTEDLDSVISQLIDRMSTKTRKPIRAITIGVPSEFCICVCKRISRKFTYEHKIKSPDIDEMYENNTDFGDSEEYSVINYSAMQYILDDGVKTMSPVGKTTKSITMDASFILVKTAFIKLFEKLFSSFAITDVEFVSTALGQAMNCQKNLAEFKPVVIVDIGHISTSVCVFKGEGMALLSSFSLGGGHISSDIMQLLGMSFKDAELIKRKVILTIESEKNENYEICAKGSLIKAPINITNQIVRSRIEKIATIINEILSIDSVFKNIDIYLTGDGVSYFRESRNIIAKITGHKVHEYKNPFDNSKDKYQTSKTGLASLVEILV